MQKNMVETILGAVVLLVAGGFLAFFYKTTDIHPATGYEITAAFSNVSGLDTGSPVTVSGVKVGQVLDFKLDPANYRAIVRMNINNDVKLPKDTSAAIKSSGFLDGKFMELQPGGEDDFMVGGDQIEITQPASNLEELLGKMIYSPKAEDKKPGNKDTTNH